MISPLFRSPLSRISKHLICQAAIAAFLFHPLSAQTLKIFVLAGQSNMEGQAFAFDDPAKPSQTVPTLEFLLSRTAAATNYLSNMPFGFKSSLAPGWISPRSDAWCVHYDSETGTTKNVQPTSTSASIFNGIGPLSPGFGVNTNNGSRIGAELAMGIRIADSTNDPVFLFKSDKGGTTLAEDWRPPSAVAARGGSLGSHYTNTVNRFRDFLDALDADLADDGILNTYGNATGYEICGFFWLQGFNESVEASGAFKPEYGANLVDLIHDLRVADERIPADLPLLIVESSDQDTVLNTGRASAVATINAEIPGSAAFLESNNMIQGYPGPVFWGNNEAGDPFSTGNGYHFHDRAENFLELGWIAGGAVLDNNWLAASDFWLDRPTIGSVAFNGADVGTRANGLADTVTVYWDTVDHGPTTSGWANSATLGTQAAGAEISAFLTASEDTTYFFRFHGTSTALATDFWTAPNTFSTPLEFPVPGMSGSMVNSTQPFGAAVQNTLLLADADVTLVWAFSDQGATTVSTWTGAAGGGSFSFGNTSTDSILNHAIAGLLPDSTYSFRFFAANANGQDWSETGSFATPQNVSGMTNLGWGWLHSENNGLTGGKNSQHDISVFPGYAGYAGSDAAGNLTSGTFGDATVEAYKFFKVAADGGTNVLTDLASGGTSITGATTDTSMGNNSAMDLWEGTAPAGFTSTADFRSNTGAAGLDDWSGSIDISTYAAGTVYFIYGHYRGGDNAAKNLDLTMKDNEALVADIQLLDVGSTDRPNNWEHYIVKIAFANTQGYDKIDYFLDFAGNGRVGGIVVEGIPHASPPSPFDGWAASFQDLTDDDLSLDFDGGGLDTGIEWVVGGDPADAGDDASNAPTLDNADPTYIIFTYRRRDAAAADSQTDIRVEYGSDLSGWRNTSEHRVTDGVLIDDATDLGGGFHEVIVSIPRALAVDERLFVRLGVSLAVAQ